MRPVLARPGRFLRDDRAAVSVEAILMLPLLFWILIATFVYWDAFRAVNTHVKATYTVADMLARQLGPVNTAFINGLDSVHRFISNVDDNDSWLRITSVQYDAATDSYVVLWSRSTGAAPALTTATLAPMAGNLPVMWDGDTAIVVEAWRIFREIIPVGMNDRTLYEFTVMRPRFLSPIPLQG
jgi:Flp pilus assembly protein TadG